MKLCSDGVLLHFKQRDDEATVLCVVNCLVSVLENRRVVLLRQPVTGHPRAPLLQLVAFSPLVHNKLFPIFRFSVLGREDEKLAAEAQF